MTAKLNRMPMPSDQTPERLPLPHLSDEARWRALQLDKTWKGIWNEDLAAALRARRPGQHARVANIIAKRLWEEITRILFKSIRSSYPNRGEDIIAEARSRILAALMNQNSESGAGLTECFEDRVVSFGTDAVRRHLKLAEKDEAAAELNVDKELLKHDVAAQLRIDVTRLIDRFPNPRQRRVCLLLLNGLPQPDRNAGSEPVDPAHRRAFQIRVAEEVGASTRSVRTWTREFLARLREAREEGLI